MNARIYKMPTVRSPASIDYILHGARAMLLTSERPSTPMLVRRLRFCVKPRKLVDVAFVSLSVNGDEVFCGSLHRLQSNDDILYDMLRLLALLPKDDIKAEFLVPEGTDLTDAAVKITLCGDVR